MNKKILILPGDGIGPEVTSSAVEILKFINYTCFLQTNDRSK